MGVGTFDTTKALYIHGIVTDVRWGNPHGEVHLRIENTNLPAGFTQRPLPKDADEENAKLTFASARPYEGDHKELHLTLAGPGWMERWGLDRPLQVGVQTGEIKLRVAGQFPPEQVGEAQRMLAAGGLRGRPVVLF
ncbi:hypothetical protein [Rhizobium leguminosarum]|uniref:hypothetical protein n=1 Tax=Rhizobium leguminosarum TaxID=384 RepID=UPI003F98DFEB